MPADGTQRLEARVLKARVVRVVAVVRAWATAAVGAAVVQVDAGAMAERAD
jgi:hypothetical protein